MSRWQAAKIVFCMQLFMHAACWSDDDSLQLEFCWLQMNLTGDDGCVDAGVGWRRRSTETSWSDDVCRWEKSSVQCAVRWQSIDWWADWCVSKKANQGRRSNGASAHEMMLLLLLLMMMMTKKHSSVHDSYTRQLKILRCNVLTTCTRSVSQPTRPGFQGEEGGPPNVRGTPHQTVYF